MKSPSRSRTGGGKAGSSSSNNTIMADSKMDFQFCFLPNFDSSLPDKTGRSVVCNAPFNPLTPDKGKMFQGSLHQEVMDLVDKTVVEGKVQEMVRSMLQHTIEDPVQLQSQDTSKPVAISYEVVASQQKEKHVVMPNKGVSFQQLENEKNGEGECQGIDLNKTPQPVTPKPRKRKHRPRVIHESKPAKTPKPETPSTKENPSVINRTYVRRKKDVNSLDTSSGVGEEHFDPDDRKATKLARRSLNFDLEEGHARADGCSGSTLTSKCNAESEAQAMEVVVENSKAGFAFDLNLSMSQMLEDNMRLPVNQTQPPQPSAREMMKDNLKDLARERDDMNFTINPERSLPSKLVTGHQSSQHIPNSTLNMSSLEKGKVNKGVRRKNTLIIQNAYGIASHLQLMQAYREINEVSEYHETSTNQSLYSPEIFKKRKREKGKHVLPFNKMESMTRKRSKTLHANFLSQAIIVQFMDPRGHEGITTAQAQNALVPYIGGDGLMVPYERLFKLIKKRRLRSKVDLDPETNRMWNFLMGKEGNDSVEGTDKDKDKWWDEEMKVFSRRAEVFIARMHLVQGNRCFSPWKGSVVDSVAGVFLTQNVSDHLSSSAFMSLAARFPLHSRSFNWVPIVEIVQVSPENWTDTPVTVTGSTSSADDRSSEDVLSSQNSFVSSQTSSNYPVQAANQSTLCSESNSEIEDMTIGSKYNGLDGSTSFTELLQMTGTKLLRELYIDPLEYTEAGKRTSTLDQVENFEGASPSMNTSNSHLHHSQHNFMGGPYVPSTADNFHNPLSSEVENVNIVGEQRRSLPSTVSGITKTYVLKRRKRKGSLQAENTTETTSQQNLLLTSVNPLVFSRTEAFHGQLSCSHINLPRETTLASSGNNTSIDCSQLKDEHTAKFQPKEREADFQAESDKHAKDKGLEGETEKKTLDVNECLSIPDKGQGLEGEEVEPNSKDEAFSPRKAPMGKAKRPIKPKKGKKAETEKKPFDWDTLRKQACCNGPKKERSCDTMDSMDWEAVRQADVGEISDAIRGRGMNNKLAERIKNFLNRLVAEHGSIDLEWLRDVPPERAKDYLLSIRGLGLKSVECVRLLTLHQLAFPVDTNIGRICVRLGWVPLQPLPESLQLHLLELYPMVNTIQKYLWPRLRKLDQRTLYELHYQMITFGKVFCTKRKPNCNACPMRGECKHFASAFASSRLALPGPEEKSFVSSTIPIVPDNSHKSVVNTMTLPQIEGRAQSQEGAVPKSCEPIIEEPQTPEPEYTGTSECAIEDVFYEDPDEIPTIKLNVEEFTQNLQNYMQANYKELQDDDLSKALVALTPEAASIPVPKLKNVSRLRTEHQVYELPDSHPLLEGLDKREANDPCSYLLAIWTPGETAESTGPPEICCNSQSPGKMCDKKTCFSCNSIREGQAQTVRGTILIPCRTAMKGTFPLNGTYFQVNEVFADHYSSHNPIDVPRKLIWNLPRRTVYFGTSIPTIFKGLTTEAIQHCFWRGFVCLRGFDRKTRAPRPLYARLHFPASKAPRNLKIQAKEE